MRGDRLAAAAQEGQGSECAEESGGGLGDSESGRGVEAGVSTIEDLSDLSIGEGFVPDGEVVELGIELAASAAGIVTDVPGGKVAGVFDGGIGGGCSHVNTVEVDCAGRVDAIGRPSHGDMVPGSDDGTSGGGIEPLTATTVDWRVVVAIVEGQCSGVATIDIEAPVFGVTRTVNAIVSGSVIHVDPNGDGEGGGSGADGISCLHGGVAGEIEGATDFTTGQPSDGALVGGGILVTTGAIGSGGS